MSDPALDSWTASDGQRYPPTTITPEAQTALLKALCNRLHRGPNKAQRTTIDRLAGYLDHAEVPLAVFPGSSTAVVLTNHQLLLGETTEASDSLVDIEDVDEVQASAGLLPSVTVVGSDQKSKISGGHKNDARAFADTLRQAISAVGAGELHRPSRLSDTDASPHPPTLRPVGREDVEVVGESFRIGTIRSLVDNTAGEHQAVARLVRQPSNPHDSNAVMVTVLDRSVGYLPRSESRRYHPLLDAMKQAETPTTARAVIWYDPDGPRGGPIGSVRLDIVNALEFAWPINTLPDNAVVWPNGRALKVNVDDTAPGLTAWLDRRYDDNGCAAYLELLAPTSDRSRLAVAFDGDIVGTVTPQTTKKLEPALTRAAEHGHRLFAVAEAKGNSLAADIKIRITPPEDLTEDQIRQLTG